MAIDDEPRDLIVLVRNEWFFEKAVQRHVGQCQLRGDAFFIVCSSNAGQPIAAAAGEAFARSTLRFSKLYELFETTELNRGILAFAPRSQSRYAVGGRRFQSGIRTIDDTIRPTNEIWKNTVQSVLVVITPGK